MFLSIGIACAIVGFCAPECQVTPGCGRVVQDLLASRNFSHGVSLDRDGDWGGTK